MGDNHTVVSIEDKQRQWRPYWRWEGTIGHHRVLRDALEQVLEDRGYIVDCPEPEMKAEPLEGVAEFSGALLATKEGVWEHRLRYGLVSIVLMIIGSGIVAYALTQSSRMKPGEWGIVAGGAVGIILGVLLLMVALARVIHHIGLTWRGESYRAGGRSEARESSTERVAVLSEVRLILRANSSSQGLFPGRWRSQHGVDDFAEDVQAVIARTETTLPQLRPPSHSDP